MTCTRSSRTRRFRWSSPTASGARRTSRSRCRSPWPAEGPPSRCRSWCWRSRGAHPASTRGRRALPCPVRWPERSTAAGPAGCCDCSAWPSPRTSPGPLCQGPPTAINPTFGVVYVLLWVGLVPASLLLGPDLPCGQPAADGPPGSSPARPEGRRRRAWWSCPPWVGLWPAAAGTARVRLARAGLPRRQPDLLDRALVHHLLRGRARRGRHLRRLRGSPPPTPSRCTPRWWRTCRRSAAPRTAPSSRGARCATWTASR